MARICEKRGRCCRPVRAKWVRPAAGSVWRLARFASISFVGDWSNAGWAEKWTPRLRETGSRVAFMCIQMGSAGARTKSGQKPHVSAEPTSGISSPVPYREPLQPPQLQCSCACITVHRLREIVVSLLGVDAMRARCFLVAAALTVISEWSAQQLLSQEARLPRLIDYSVTADGVVLTFDGHPQFAQYRFDLYRPEPERFDEEAHNAWQEAWNAWNAQCDLGNCGEPPPHYDRHEGFAGGASHAWWEGSLSEWANVWSLESWKCGYLDGWITPQCWGGDTEMQDALVDYEAFESNPETYTITLWTAQNPPYSQEVLENWPYGGTWTISGTYQNEEGNYVHESFSGVIGEVVPEPSALLIAVFGFSGVLTHQWFRRRKRVRA